MSEFEHDVNSPDPYVERKIPPPVRPHTFKWSRPAMRLMVGRYMGAGTWEQLPYKLDDAMALASEFSRAITDMLDVFGKNGWRFSSNVDLRSFERVSKRRIKVSVMLFGQQFDRTFRLEHLRPLAELLVDMFEETHGPNWRR